MFSTDLDILNLNDLPTWNLICSGDTRGVFQLESPLGRTYAKRLQPRNIQELSDLIAIIRPGALEALLEDGKTVTNHYIERKFGKEEVTYVHPALEPILKKTQGLIVYQEQALRIARELAGFTLTESNELRKSIGKKIPEEMAKSKVKFLEGCIKVGILNKEQSEEIFGWIEKSQRYSFVLAHSVEYALNAYMTAYLKAHHPKEFFTGWLKHAEEKSKPFIEISALINNARFHNIDVLPPNVLKSEDNFSLQDERIYYGLTNIKGVGTAAIFKFRADFANHIMCFNSQDWLSFLFKIGVDYYSLTKIFIKVGALPFKLPRAKMLYELEVVEKLSPKELKWCKLNIRDTLLNTLLALIENSVPTKKRLATIQDLCYIISKPSSIIADDAASIATDEKFFLGIAMTCNKVDDKDKFQANTTCIEFLKTSIQEPVIAATVINLKEYIMKNGKNKGQPMGFLTIDDGTCELDCTLFYEQYKEYAPILNEEATVLVVGYRSKKDKNSMVVTKILEI